MVHESWGLEEGLNLFYEGGLGAGAYGLVDDFASLDEEDGGDVADAVLGGEGVVLIYVGLAYEHAACVFFGEFVDDGGNLLAGAAPGGAEINYEGESGSKGFVVVVFVDNHKELGNFEL